MGSLRIAMLKEAIGIGPQRCYVYFHLGLDFYRKLMLIMTYLPHEKMFLYLGEARLGAPFLQEPWLSRGDRPFYLGRLFLLRHSMIIL